MAKQVKSCDFNAQGAWFEYAFSKTGTGWVIEGDSVYPKGMTGTFRGEITTKDKNTHHYKGAGVLTQDGQKYPVTLKYKATRLRRKK